MVLYYNNGFCCKLVVHITDTIIQHKSTKMVGHTVAHIRIGVVSFNKSYTATQQNSHYRQNKARYQYFQNLK